VRLVALLGLVVWSAVALTSQSLDLSQRILSTGSRTFVTFDALMADIAGADVVFVEERASTPDVHRFEAAVLQALAGRREVVLALDAIDRAAQDPLEHFQMGHLSDQEFVTQAGMAAAAGAAYVPLMKLAIARTWPIVATGPFKAGGEGSMASALVQALAIGSAGGKRPLLVSLHAGARPGVVETAADFIGAPSSARRAVIVQLVSVPSLEMLKPPPAAAPAGAGYVIYTRR
jgi:hypothetical protein